MLNNRLKERQHFRHNLNFDSQGVHSAVGGQFVKNRPKLLKDYEEEQFEAGSTNYSSPMDKYVNIKNLHYTERERYIYVDDEYSINK
jgi:hypothetical protein